MHILCIRATCFPADVNIVSVQVEIMVNGSMVFKAMFTKGGGGDGGREGGVASVSSCRMQLSKRESGGFSHTKRGPAFEALSKGSLFLKERICSWKSKILS